MRVFATALASGLSLESEWQQVSSCFQNSSWYSGRSQSCFNLDGLDSSRPFSKSLRTVSSAPTTIYISVMFLFQSFSILWQGLSIYSSFCFIFIFPLWSFGTQKSTIPQMLSFIYLFIYFCKWSQYLGFWPGLDGLFVSQNSWEVSVFHSAGRILVCACTFS